MKNAERQKVGRKRTGTVEPAGAHADGSPRFRFRLRLGDGTKSERYDVPHGLDRKQAGAFVAGLQAEEDAHGKLRARSESARAFSQRMGASRTTWKAPMIGFLATS